jgi:hypothetical protein
LKAEEDASGPLAGGIVQHGYQCGMVWGAALAAGAEAHHRFGVGPRAEAMTVRAARRVVDAFRASNQTVDCLDITGIDQSSSSREMNRYFFLKGGIIKCYRMAVRYAPPAAEGIEAALSETYPDPPDPPVSCAALLAQQMGASDMHQVLTAGLAGGIGLSGAGCGALGAAIWLVRMNTAGEDVDPLSFDDPQILATIARFTECTGSTFECSKIVGRQFASIDDHAAYLRAGGCSEVIDALAAA